MITIRAISVADLRQISYIHVDTWKHAYQGIVPQDVLNRLSYGRSQDNWKRCYNRMSQYFYVAEVDHAVVGFAVGGIQREEDQLYEGEIYAMYILPDFQKQGIGKMLMKRLAKDFYAEGWKEFIVWCLQKNPAKAFYENMGGVQQEITKIKIGGKPLVKIGYVYNSADFIE